MHNHACMHGTVRLKRLTLKLFMFRLELCRILWAIAFWKSSVVDPDTDPYQGF
jgi:hypothetical protein